MRFSSLLALLLPVWACADSSSLQFVPTSQSNMDEYRRAIRFPNGNVLVVGRVQHWADLKILQRVKMGSPRHTPYARTHRRRKLSLSLP
jgi:hypothetical protein